MEFMPIFARLAGRQVLVVGGGGVALRKVKLLRRAGACVTVNAPQLCPELEELAGQGAIWVVRSRFAPELMQRAFLVVAATDEADTNAQVFQVGEQLGRLVNSVDDPTHCSFITPAIVDRSPLIVAISSGAAAPALARRLRIWLEARLPEALGKLVELAHRYRSQIAGRFPDPAPRRRFFDWLVDRSPVPAALDHGRQAEAEEYLERALADRGPASFAGGRVVLAGAGPGDPGLLTLRALRHLECADVILYDRLVTPEILERARRDAQFVPVEKEAGGGGWSQETILSELARHAEAGRYVVRLKGGDPFIFGRGGEEAEFLRRRGIPVEVVPGITAALGCAAAAGIPLTHRADSHSLCLLTAVGQEGTNSLPAPLFAGPQQTLAVYMGVRVVARLQEALLSAGHQAWTPAAVVENGTTPRQRVLFCRLGDLAATVLAQEVTAPAMVFVGAVVRRAPGFALAYAAAPPGPAADGAIGQRFSRHGVGDGQPTLVAGAPGSSEAPSGIRTLLTTT